MLVKGCLGGQCPLGAGIPSVLGNLDPQSQVPAIRRLTWSSVSYKSKGFRGEEGSIDF